MPSPVDALQAAGFNNDEIAAWSTERRKVLSDGGFPDNEIDAYFTGGVVAPTQVPRALEDRLAAGEEAGKREGGLLQTLPQFGHLVSTPEGRGKLWEAVKQYPSKFLADMVETAQTPGDVAAGRIDLTTEDGLDRALGLGTLVGLGRFSKINKTGKTSGLALGMGDQVARVERTPTGEVFDHPVGALPNSADFVTAAKAIIQPSTETIASPAAQFRGEIFQAPIHAVATENAVKKFGLSVEEFNKAFDAGEYQDGYVTSTGRFISRPEALAIADGGDIGHGLNSVGVALQAPPQSAPMAMQQKLLKVYEEQGRLPAEVAHDAQTDPVVAQRMLSKDPADIPYVEAYHASPHDFEAFDISKIGTGEGAQTRGHGLYFAENEAVSGRGGQYWKDFIRRESDNLSADTPEGIATRFLSEHSGDVEKAINQAIEAKDQLRAFYREQAQAEVHTTGPLASIEEALPKSPKEDFDRTLKLFDDTIDLLRSGKHIGPHVYRVRILADREHFLDWDKPLSEQPANVQDALRKAGLFDESLTGEELYKSLVKNRPGSGGALNSAGMKLSDLDATPENVSGWLHRNGIPGIKYLDQGSRAGQSIKGLERQLAENRAAIATVESQAGSNTREMRLGNLRRDESALINEIGRASKKTSNFVVFDDKSVEITHKNGEPLTKAERADAMAEMGGAGGGQPPEGPVVATVEPPPPPPPAGSFAEAQAKVLDKISIGEGDRARPYTFSRLYRETIDDLHPLKAIDQNAYELARLTRGSFGKAEQFLERSTFDFKTLKDNGRPLKEILAPVADDMNGLRAYLAARRALEVEATGRQSGVDLEAAQRVVDGSPKELGRVAERLVNYQNRLLAYLRDSGVISGKSFDAMVEAGKAYVPFYRLMGEETGGKGAGSSLGPGNPVKRLKGSEREIIDPLESIIKNTYAYISIAERNAAGIELVEALKKQGFEVKEALTAKSDAETMAYLKEQGVTTPEALRDFVQHALPETGDTISAMRDGKRLEVTVDDPELVAAFRGMDRGSVGLLTKVFSVPAKALRAGAVLTPDFMARNLIRDFMTAFVNTSGAIFTPIDTAKGLVSVIRRDADYQNWVKGGGANATMVGLDRAYMQESLSKLSGETGLMERSWNVLKHPIREGLKPLRMLSELIENATRVGEFKKAAKVAGAEPSVPRGHTRLYRGETDTPGQTTQLPDWLKESPEVQATFDATGRWFVRDRATAEYYNKTFGDKSGRLSYVDVPTAGVEQYLSANQPEAKKFSAAGRDAEEYFVPREIADKRQPVPTSTSKEAIQAAAYGSREVTLDFAKMGAKMRAYNMLTAFGNPQIQGVDRIVRAFHDRPVTTMAKVAGGITLPSVLLWWANHDDPRYQELPAWQRDLFWIIPTDKWEPISPADAAGKPAHLVHQRGDQTEFNNGSIWRIPKPFELGVIFGSGPERALDLLIGNDPEAFKNFGKSMQEVLTPGFIPTAAQPLYEQYANRSTFTDRTLIPADVEKLLPEYQSTPYTTELSKKLGQVFSAFPGMRNAATDPGNPAGPTARALTTPILIENYVRSWTGGLGMYAMQAADASLRKAGVLPDPIKPTATLADIPFVRAFAVRYPSATAESIQSFHDDYAQNKRFFDTWQAKAREGDVVAMGRIQAAGGPMMFVQLDGINQALSEHSKLVRDVYKNPTMPADQKRQLIDSMYFNMVQIAKGGRQIMKQAEVGLMGGPQPPQ